MFTIRECLAWWKNVDDLSGAFPLTFLNCHRLTQLILTCMHWSKELYELLFIAHIEFILLIDTLSISDIFSDSYALIRLHSENPKAQKCLWLHHIKRTPNQDLETWSTANDFKSRVFEQFDPNSAEDGIAILLTEIQEISYLDRIHCHPCSHSGVLPINGIKCDRELVTDSPYLFFFLIRLFLLLAMFLCE